MNTFEPLPATRPAYPRRDDLANRSRLPQLVQKLAPREREIAEIVYGRVGCTAKQIELLLSVPLSNGAIRSMLRRLESKGIIKHRRRGAYRTFVYLPAITTDDARRKALVQVANDYFDGSLALAGAAIARLIVNQIGEERPNSASGR
jgi:predicted transcriptional regulator